MAKFQWGGGGEGTLPSQNSKCQDLPKFQFLGEGILQSKLKILKVPRNLLNFNLGGGGVLCQVKTQSAKIYLNFNFFEGYSSVKTENTQNAKKWLNFNLGGGILFSQNSKYSKCKEMAKFQFSGGGFQFSGGALFREWGHSQNFGPKFTV